MRYAPFIRRRCIVSTNVSPTREQRHEMLQLYDQLISYLEALPKRTADEGAALGIARAERDMVRSGRWPIDPNPIARMRARVATAEARYEQVRAQSVAARTGQEYGDLIPRAAQHKRADWQDRHDRAAARLNSGRRIQTAQH